MNYMVFDTETTSVNKPFCYNIGYVIVNSETGDILVSRDYVVEQIWHNMALFSTAYYAEKRPIYVNRMRSRKVKMGKFGNICQQMIRDMEAFDVSTAYAYNSRFDDGVFDFNCDWFKCINPFDNIQIIDIMGYVHRVIAFTPEFQKYCEVNSLFTESGNYSSTAETVYKYLLSDTSFEEEHTALSDSKIENDILEYCVQRGCEWNTEYKRYSSIPRKRNELFTVKVNKDTVFEAVYNKKTTRGNTVYLTTED